jgi:hypothetical protein
VHDAFADAMSDPFARLTGARIENERFSRKMRSLLSAA